MASPIPTQLSPGVNVSEIDLSQFVQPESLNSGGMVGSFNWGPCLVANRVTSESDLAALFGKPTLDPSDSLSEIDFFAAANFLKYSNNLKVIRIEQSAETNSTSQEAGITSINNCTYPRINNEAEFAKIGGFSGQDGIEPIAHFRAKYPGNFGDSLKVIVWDGATNETESINTTTTTTAYTDFNLFGGYNLASMVGISSGTIGYTFEAKRNQFGLDAADFDGFVSLGFTSGSHQYTIVSVVPPSNKTATEFINTLAREPFKFFYATGTTGQNLSLTSNGSEPSGNNSNYYVLENVSSVGTHFNPFAEFNPSVNPSRSIFAKINPTNSNVVDILFLNADSTNMNPGFITPSITAKSPNPAIFKNFQTSGIPSHFESLIYTGGDGSNLFVTYRSTWSKIAEKIFNSVSGTPSTSVKGWNLLVGLTGGVTFVNTVNGTQQAIGITFDVVGGLAGTQRDFAFGMKQFGNSSTVTNTTTTTITESLTSISIFDKIPNTSAFASNVGGSNDEISFAVIDTGGKFGAKNGVLERFQLLSKATDAKNLDGESIYYKDYINNKSRLVYCTKPFSLTGGGNASSNATTAFGDIQYSYVDASGSTYTRKGFYESQLAHGESSISTPTTLEYTKAYSIFADDDSAVDVLFVPESSVSNDASQATTDMVERIAYDTVISPRKDTVLVIPSPKPGAANQYSSQTATNTINFRKNVLQVPSNSYTILVAGRKIFFDTFNNQLRKMSLASDVAGILCAQEIPWESPAGFSRGFIRNAVKLETNFSKADRDELYKNGINFFVQFNDGSGTVLYSDKTMLTKPSAFDRINVRRVFIALEKAIAKAAKYSLFEFNDEFTRSQFRNLVTPFLSSVQAQRGIADFKVVCDETNNTSQVIDNNQFVADIYIKPLKSINFVQLNFVAVRSDFNLTTIE
jgi:hypothetical protein